MKNINIDTVSNSEIFQLKQFGNRKDIEEKSENFKHKGDLL